MGISFVNGFQRYITNNTWGYNGDIVGYSQELVT